MPNHCHNRLQVIGPGPSVAAFLAKASSPDTLGERGLLSFLERGGDTHPARGG